MIKSNIFFIDKLKIYDIKEDIFWFYIFKFKVKKKN